MSKYYSVNYASIITDANIKGLNNWAYQALQDALDEQNVTFEAFAKAMASDSFIKDKNGNTISNKSYQLIRLAYIDFCTVFELDTGLTIFDPVGWRYAGGRLTLVARRGHGTDLVFENGQWRKDPAVGAPLLMRKLAQ